MAITTVPEQNSQPQVRDITNGPQLYTYIPRDDGSVLINGVVYKSVPSPAPTAAAGVATTDGVADVPIVTQAAPIAPALVASFENMPALAQPMFYAQPGVVPLPSTSAVPLQTMHYSPYIYAPIQPIQPMGVNIAYPHFIQPGFGTVGFTSGEMMMQNIGVAQNSEMNQKQDMKPADDDKLRMYWVREPDGSWTQRNRLTIDSGDIGNCRWYAIDGYFYAVRMDD